MRSVFALALTLLCAASAGAQHNGQKAWPVKDYVGVFQGGAQPYLLFRTATGPAEIVPIASGFLHGSEFVVKTRTALRTFGGWVNIPNNTVALVTHSDADFHSACLVDMFAGPTPTLMAPMASYETYYVDDNWRVHKVATPRRTRESRSAWVRRHAGNLKDYSKAFPCNKENTKKWALARAASMNPRK